MPLVATDDAARRQWFVWLGPTNSPWPFEARGRSWVMAVLTVPALWTVLGLAFLAIARATGTGAAWAVVAVVASLAAGTGLGVWAVTRVSRVLSDTRPLRHWLWLVVAEADAPRPDTPTAWGMPDPHGLDASRDDARTHALASPDRLFDTEKEPTR